MDKHILIAIMLDNGHLYSVRIKGDEERYFEVERADKDVPAKVCMDIAEEYSLEDNLKVLREGLEEWEKIQKMVEDDDEEENDDRSVKIS